MKCPQRGQDNPDSSARFCNGCGVTLETRCTACGQSNPPSSRFRNGCGQALAAASPRFERTPESYTRYALKMAPTGRADSVVVTFEKGVA
jgi:hypothetical protein